MAIFILSALAIICLYEAIVHTIYAIYQYKYAGMIARILQDADTRQLFVQLRPYMTDYIRSLRHYTDAYARDVDSIRDYRKFVKNEKSGIQRH